MFDNLGGVDNITDFGTGNDVLAFDNSVFTSLTPEGPLASANFVLGTAAADANDFLIYDQASGSLYYDADGSNAGAAELIVQLKAGTTLAADDISIL